MKILEFPIKIKFNVRLQFSVLCALVFLSILTACQADNSPFSDISVNDVSKKMGGDAFILDVRQPDEYVQGHVPGAVLIPLDTLPNRLSEVPKDKEIIVVCRTGVRSAQGRDILKDAGFENVHSMTGGITAWIKQGYPVVTGLQ